MRYNILFSITLSIVLTTVMTGCVGRKYSVSDAMTKPGPLPEFVAKEQDQQDLLAESLEAEKQIEETIQAEEANSLPVNNVAAILTEELKAEEVGTGEKNGVSNRIKIRLASFMKKETESDFEFTEIFEDANEYKNEDAPAVEFAALPAPVPVSKLEPAELPVVNEVYVPNVQGMTLYEFEEMALANNPTIKQLSAAASRARGLRHQVGISANPTIGYSAGQVADKGTDQHVLFIEREFVRGNKLALNRKVLSRATQAQMWEVETQRNRVLTDIRVRYYAAVASQRIRELAVDFSKISQKGAGIAKLRREALEGTQIDVLQAQIQLNEIDIRRQQAEYAFQGAWKELAAIAGMPYLPPTQLIENMKPEARTQDWDSTYESLIANSPELNAAQFRVSEARANLERQKAQPISNITAQLGAGIDNGTGSGMINFQISAPLPSHNRNSGNISAAYAKYCQTTHEVKRIELAIKARLATVSRDYDSAHFSVIKYEKEILPKAQQTLDLSEEAYQAGELHFLNVLIVQRTYFESNLQYINAIKDLAQANAKIEGLLLTGGLDKPNDFTSDDSLRGQTFSGQ